MLGTLSRDDLVVELQKAFRDACGVQPSDAPHIRKKWLLVADYLLSGGQTERSDLNALAVELHAVYVGQGHRTEIMHRADYDPALIGWRGVAAWVMEHPLRPSPTTGASPAERLLTL